VQNIFSSYVLAKTDPSNSRTVSLRTLIGLHKYERHFFHFTLIKLHFEMTIKNVKQTTKMQKSDVNNNPIIFPISMKVDINRYVSTFLLGVLHHLSIGM